MNESNNNSETANGTKPMLAEIFKKWKDSGIYENMPKEYQLIFSRKIWELSTEYKMGYSFTKEELDKAEKSDDGLIGKQNGVNCYLQRPFNFR